MLQLLRMRDRWKNDALHSVFSDQYGSRGGSNWIYRLACNIRIRMGSANIRAPNSMNSNPFTTLQQYIPSSNCSYRLPQTRQPAFPHTRQPALFPQTRQWM